LFNNLYGRGDAALDDIGAQGSQCSATTLLDEVFGEATASTRWE